MKPKALKTKEKIVLATINCIEKEGVHAVRTRHIAREAGVNIATINYYFGSKEKLIQQALRQTMEHALEDFEMPFKMRDLTPKERIRCFLQYAMDGGIKWPNVTLSHLYDTLINHKYNTTFMKRFNQFLGRTVKELAEGMPAVSRRELNMSMIAMVSAIMFVVLLPRAFKAFSDIDFHESKSRNEYVTYLVNKLWKE